ncbi:hypothetical protein MXB_1284, partial [Myxobolus squamalis]
RNRWVIASRSSRNQEALSMLHTKKYCDWISKSWDESFDNKGNESENVEYKKDNKSLQDAEASLQLIEVFLNKGTVGSENEEYK